MKKAWAWITEDCNWLYVCMAAVVLAIFGGIVYFIATYTPLGEGVVINKFYEPAHSVYSPVTLYVNGKTEIIPTYKMVGDKWRVDVRNGEDEDIWYVSEEFYNAVHVGDWVKK